MGRLMPAQTRADRQRLGGVNGRNVLAERDVREIRAELAHGRSRSWCARAHGVTKSTVQSIAEGRSWSWLT